MMKKPVPDQIETERLLLRRFVIEDWEALHEYYGDERATAHTVGKASTEGETWRFLCMMAGHWQLRGYGPYGIVEADTRRLIGLAGYWYPNDWPAPEIKYALARSQWGKGFASEAVRALQEVGRSSFGPGVLISFIQHENELSMRLAKAVGAVFEEEVPFRGSRWRIYRHP